MGVGGIEDAKPALVLSRFEEKLNACKPMSEKSLGKMKVMPIAQGVADGSESSSSSGPLTNKTAEIITQLEQLVCVYEEEKNKKDMLIAQQLNKSRSNFNKKAVIGISAIVIGGAALYYFRPRIIDNTRGLYKKFFNISCEPCTRTPTYSQGYSAGYSAGVSNITSGIVAQARTLTSSHDYSINALRKIGAYIQTLNPGISIARLFGLKE